MSNSVRAVREISIREIRVRTRTKAFRATTALLVLLAIAGVVGVSLFGNGDEPDRYRIVPTLSEAEEAVASGDVDVVITEDQLIWDQDRNLELSSLLNAVSVGLQNEEKGVAAPTPFAERFLDETDEQTRGFTIGVALIGVIGSFALIQGWGSLVAMGVIEEKASRVVEVLLAHATPTQLITGKVIGLGLLAMGQALVVLIGLIGALLVTDSVDVPSSAWGAVALMLAIVAAGFAFYSVMFAAGGSLVSRTEDAQQVMMPLMLPLMGGYFVSTASLTNPENPLVTVLSFLPFTMRTVMPLRLAGGAAQWWEVALAFAILLGSTVLVARLAGRLYHVSLLQAGSRIKRRDALTIIRN